jgi:hypothetical protein
MRRISMVFQRDENFGAIDVRTDKVVTADQPFR